MQIRLFCAFPLRTNLRASEQYNHFKFNIFIIPYDKGFRKEFEKN